METFAVQCIVRVQINDKHIQSWGCMSNEENSILVEWFQTNKAKAYKSADEVADVDARLAKIIFAKL